MSEEQLTQDQARKEMTERLENTLQVMTPKNKNDAIGIMANLFHFDERYAKQPFSLIINDIIGSVMHDQYEIVGINIQKPDKPDFIQPMACLTWCLLDPTIAVVKANNIRPIAPIEFKSGPVGYFNMFCSPFEQPDVMIDVVRRKSNKLQQLTSMTFVDNLFKPDYNFKTTT